jgi:hypothetical protein
MRKIQVTNRMSGVVNVATRAMLEGFTNQGDTYRQGPVYADALATIIALWISITIVALVGLWLWNFSVVPLFEFARPAKSVFQILGLMVLLALIHP